MMIFAGCVAPMGEKKIQTEFWWGNVKDCSVWRPTSWMAK